MKNEQQSQQTKARLAEALRGFMERKPLSKITVSDIIRACGVNRKTFYYHFEDIYALLKWMLEQEAFDVVLQFDMMTDYREAVAFALRYVRENKILLCCAYDSMGRDEMKRFFHRDFIGITRQFIRTEEKRLALHMNEEYKDVLANMCTFAIAGMLVEEFKKESDADAGMLAQTIQAMIIGALEHAPINGKG